MRSPLPTASRTRRVWSGAANSAKRADSGTLNTGAAGSAYSVSRKVERRGGVRPAADDAGQAAGDEVGVDGLSGVEAEGVAGFGRVEGTECHVVGAAEEWAVVGGEPLHHVHVAAEQQQQDWTGGEQPVPRGLQGAVEQLVLLGQPGNSSITTTEGAAGRTEARTRKASGQPPAARVGTRFVSTGRDDSRSSARNVVTASTSEAPLVAVKNR